MRQICGNTQKYRSGYILYRLLESLGENIKKLKGVNFTWKETCKKDIGAIAQEIEKVYPELVDTHENTGLKSVVYSKLVAPIINSIKTLSDKIDDLFEKYFDQEEKIEINNCKNSIFEEKVRKQLDAKICEKISEKIEQTMCKEMIKNEKEIIDIIKENEKAIR